MYTIYDIIYNKIIRLNIIYETWLSILNNLYDDIYCLNKILTKLWFLCEWVW
jgi:hypothetical protein